MEKQERQIVVSDSRIRVSGDFGGGYTMSFRATPEGKRQAVLQAMIYMPGARVIGLTADEQQAMGL